MKLKGRIVYVDVKEGESKRTGQPYRIVQFDVSEVAPANERTRGEITCALKDRAVMDGIKDPQKLNGLEIEAVIDSEVSNDFGTVKFLRLLSKLPETVFGNGVAAAPVR